MHRSSQYANDRTSQAEMLIGSSNAMSVPNRSPFPETRCLNYETKFSELPKKLLFSQIWEEKQKHTHTKKGKIHEYIHSVVKVLHNWRATINSHFRNIHAKFQFNGPCDFRKDVKIYERVTWIQVR